MYNIAITTKILQTNYLYDSYINFQFELDKHVFLYERAMTRYMYLEISYNRFFCMLLLLSTFYCTCNSVYSIATLYILL